MGSRAVRRSARLAWDALLELYGGDDVLRQRINELKQANVDGADELVALAERYLAGWRPDRLEH
jgi:hypothetical protein